MKYANKTLLASIVMLISLFGIQSIAVNYGEYSSGGKVANEIYELSSKSETQKLIKTIRNIPFDKLKELAIDVKSRIELCETSKMYTSNPTSRLGWQREIVRLHHVRYALKKYSTTDKKLKLAASLKLADAMVTVGKIKRGFTRTFVSTGILSKAGKAALIGSDIFSVPLLLYECSKDKFCNHAVGTDPVNASSLEFGANMYIDNGVK